MDDKDVKNEAEAFIWVLLKIGNRAKMDHELNELLKYMISHEPAKDGGALTSIIRLDALSIVSDYSSFEENLDLLCIKLRRKYRELKRSSQ